MINGNNDQNAFIGKLIIYWILKLNFAHNYESFVYFFIIFYFMYELHNVSKRLFQNVSPNKSKFK